MNFLTLLKSFTLEHISTSPCLICGSKFNIIRLF